MLQSPLNNVIVQVATKYTRNITKLLRIAAIQNDSSIEPADYVQIVGTVISAPKEISTWKREYRGFCSKDIKPGDACVFSHSVIYEFLQTEPDADPIYKNSFWWDGQEYFNCDITRLFAVIRAGEIRMQNGYVMLEDIEKQSRIILPAKVKKSIKTSSATITGIGAPLTHLPKIDADIGDRVYFSPNIAQKFHINEKPFSIISQHQILGKEQLSYADLVRVD